MVANILVPIIIITLVPSLDGDEHQYKHIPALLSCEFFLYIKTQNHPVSETSFKCLTLQTIINCRTMIGSFACHVV